MILSPKRFGFIAWLLIPALLGYLTQDFSYALNQGSTGQKQSVDSPLTGADSEIRFDDLLIELKNALQPAIGTASQQDASGRTAIDLSLVRGIRANLVRQDQQVRAYFEKQKSFLASRGLSGELTKRLEEMAQAYDANWKSLSTHLGRIDPAVTSPFGLLSRALGRDPRWSGGGGKKSGFIFAAAPASPPGVSSGSGESAAPDTEGSEPGSTETNAGRMA